MLVSSTRYFFRVRMSCQSLCYPNIKKQILKDYYLTS